MFILLILIVHPLAFFLAFFGIKNNPSNWRRYLPLLVYFAFIGAYSFTPALESNVDLVRYLPKIESFGRLSFFEALTYNNSALLTQNLLFWFFGKLHMAHMVPALTTAVIYAIAGYITCDTAERYKAKQYIWIVLIIQMFWLPYFSIINNIRNVCGLSIVVLAVYLDIIKEKRNIFVWLCYLTGTLMHFSVISFLFFRILCVWAKKHFGLCLWSLGFVATAVSLLHNYRGMLLGNAFLLSAFHTIEGKLFRSFVQIDMTRKYAQVAMSSISLMTDRILSITEALLIVMLVFYILRSKRKFFDDDNRYYTFLGLVALMALAFFSSPIPNYWRFVAALNVSIGVIYIPMLRNYRQLSFVPSMLCKLSLFLAPLHFCVQIWGIINIPNLTSWVGTILTTNYITVLYDFIEGVL